jgi:hypothetical protein
MLSGKQIQELLKQVLPILGTLAATFGWIAPEKVEPLISSIAAAAGPVLILAGVVWGLISSTKAARLNSAAEVPEVTKISIAPMGADLASINEASRLVRDTRAEVQAAMPGAAAAPAKSATA